MALTPERLYRFHIENLRAVTTGVDQVQRQLRAVIARQEQVSSDALLKVFLLLLGGWAECRLKKLLYEPNGFDAAQRRYIFQGRNQLEQWTRAIEIGFRKRYNLPRAVLERNLRPISRLLFQEIMQTIESDLRPIIEMRNTLAHGQWIRPLNSTNDNIVPTMITALNNENALSGNFKLTILERLAAIVHDLVSGNVAFERDFDKHYVRLETARRNLVNRDYERWRLGMVAKYSRGVIKRNKALGV